MMLILFLMSWCSMSRGIFGQESNVTRAETGGMRPLKERTCVPGFVCKYGHCVRSRTLKCVCDDGYIGVFCEKLCPLDCGVNGNCVVVDGSPRCACDWRYRGPKCNETNIITISEIKNRGCENCATSTETTSQATTLSSTERKKECFPGFTCHHGYCPNGKIECICDRGWIGAFCSQPCPLQCGENGKCGRVGQAAFACICSTGYTGIYCEKPIQEPTTLSIISVISTPSITPTITVPTDVVTKLSTSEEKKIVTMQTTTQEYCGQSLNCEHGYCQESNITGGRSTCICEPGWYGISCNRSCSRLCEEYINCDMLSNGTTNCSCSLELCIREIIRKTFERYDTGAGHSHVWIIGIFLLLLLIFLIFAVSIFYHSWKKNNPFVMKIFNYFKPYENDDGKLFDAYLSYKPTPSTEHFVKYELLPHLEEELHFRLCLQSRNFDLNEPLPLCLKRAVEGSRRTIVLVTPDYLNSVECGLEYEQAHYHARKNKNRLIVIILDDVTDEMISMEKPLKRVLKSSIIWPADGQSSKRDKFWKILALLMPKKKPIEPTTKSNSQTVNINVLDVKESSNGFAETTRL